LRYDTDPATVLNARSQEILAAWRELVFASYPEPAAQLIRGTPDPFRNPLGYRLHEGTAAVMRALAAGAGDHGAFQAALDPLMRPQAIRGQPPSEGIGFVFLLKRAIRNVLGDSVDTASLENMDRRVDDLALAAFDVYSRCRDEVQEIRVRAMRRRVASIFDHLGADAGSPDQGEAGAVPVPLVMEVKA
jgi:hypothetical protein